MITPERERLESPVVEHIDDVGEETLKELSGNRGEE